MARIDFILPYGDSRLTAIIDFFLCLMAKIDFIPPDGNSRLTAIINFFFASRQESISFRLTAITPHGVIIFFIAVYCLWEGKIPLLIFVEEQY